MGEQYERQFRLGASGLCVWEGQYVDHSGFSSWFVYGVERLVGIRLEKVLKIGFYLFFRKKGDPHGG